MQKSWLHALAILNISKKLKKLYENILELKVHFKSKLILIQGLDEKDWIKLMCIKYITYNFLTAIGHGCLWFMKHYQTKENWKKIAMQSIKSPPL
jgi:hypothetical protein